jgi:hypothetical protein
VLVAITKTLRVLKGKKLRHSKKEDRLFLVETGETLSLPETRYIVNWLALFQLAPAF